MAVSAPASDLILAADAVIDTPALVVSESILHNNIASMQAFANSVGVGLRPHIKTHKTPQITKLQLAAGAIGITCAKVGEAEVMVDQAGVEEVLIAYPTIGATKIARIVSLLERARIIVAVDSLEAANAISSDLKRYDRRLDVVVEINTGQDRSGVRVGEEAVQAAIEVSRLPNLNVVGIFTHEGHANSAPPENIEAIALEAGKAMVETAEAIREHGVNLEIVSVGSTPASHYTPNIAGITEMRPGTYVFNDNSIFRYGGGVDDCAARFAATVVSRPARDRAVVDTGAKSLALDPSKVQPGHGFIVGHPNVHIVKLSEEHGVCTVPEDEPDFEIGTRVEIIPNHICPTVNLMNELFIVRDGQVIDTWAVAARGMVR